MRVSDFVPPMPPLERRRTVGHEATEHFENPRGVLAFGTDAPTPNYRSALDLGCGCGRLAQLMMLQGEGVPERFLGLDPDMASILWCRHIFAGRASSFAISMHGMSRSTEAAA